MVFIYSITSWLGFVIEEERRDLVLNLTRDLCEAYVLYNFEILMMNSGLCHYHLSKYLKGQFGM